MYVDSHCHLDFPEFAAELPALLDAMAAARVTHALCIGVNLPDWPAVHALAMAHPNLYATVGVHPDAERHARAHGRCARRPRGAAQGVAIGETGLDYYRLDGRSRLAARALPRAHPRRVAGAKAAGDPYAGRRAPTRWR